MIYSDIELLYCIITVLIFLNNCLNSYFDTYTIKQYTQSIRNLLTKIYHDFSYLAKESKLNAYNSNTLV